MVIIFSTLYTHSTTSSLYFIIYSFPSACMQREGCILASLYFITIYFFRSVCMQGPGAFLLLLFINFLFPFISNAPLNISWLVTPFQKKVILGILGQTNIKAKWQFTYPYLALTDFCVHMHFPNKIRWLAFGTNFESWSDLFLWDEGYLACFPLLLVYSFYSLFYFFILNILIIDTQCKLTYLYCKLINLCVKWFFLSIC